MGPTESLSKPIGLKIMKARTVKITIHRIGSIREGHPTKEPAWFPTKAELEEHLNKIFETQVNAKFVATLKPLRNLEWDLGSAADYSVSDPNNLVTPGNGKLDYYRGDPGSEQGTIHSLSDGDANINVYILGGGRINQVYETDGILRQTGSIISGIAYPEENMVFIDGDIGWYNTSVGRDNNAELLHTVAHEIGHCILGEGHPDEGTGPAALKGLLPKSAVQERLMVSGLRKRRPNFGCRLVKGEWDAAETWLKARPLGDH